MAQSNGSRSGAQPNVWILAADNNPSLIEHLRANPNLASAQDESGYSVLHAAISYNHLELARRLVNEFHVDVNVLDGDGESPVFSAETVEAAKVLVEELGADVSLKSSDGWTPAQKILDEGDWPLVGAYLAEAQSKAMLPSGAGSSSGTSILSNGPTRPPPLPEGVSVNVGAMEEQSMGDDADVVDPEFKRRIDALAAREDFQGDEGQRQLRELITEAVRDHVVGEAGEREVRQRTG